MNAMTKVDEVMVNRKDTKTRSRSEGELLL
jgi:hypothetical protein